MALGRSMGYSLLRIFIAVFVLGIIWFFLSSFAKIDFNSYSAESELFIHRTLYSPYGISYHDSLSGRIYPGTVDFNKFRNSTLQKLVDFGEQRHIGAKFVLRDLNNNPISTIVYNPLILKEQARLGISGPGGVDQKLKKIYVNLENHNLSKAMLDMQIIVERSR